MVLILLGEYYLLSFILLIDKSIYTCVDFLSQYFINLAAWIFKSELKNILLNHINFKKMISKKSKENKYALVTGATSGIGYELVRQLAGNGYNLVLVARNADQLEKVGMEFSNYGVKVHTLKKDLFEPNAAKEIYDFTHKNHFPIEVLVNDAGQGEHGKFIDIDLQRHLDIIQLNIISLMSLTYYFLKDMVKRNEGRILQLGSEVSKVPSPLMSVYAATKAFVLSFSEAVINEIKESNVTMTVLMPGATDTDFFHKANMEDTKVYREGKLESPVDVAADAFKAMMKGDRRVVSSNAKKNVAMATVTPDNINANKMEKSMLPSIKPVSETRHNPNHKQSLLEKKKVKIESSNRKLSSNVLKKKSTKKYS